MSKQGWRHAFAVDPPGPAEPTVFQRPAVDWVCIQIAKRHLSTPGLIFLEMTRPLNWLSAQAMHFTKPGAWAIMTDRGFEGYSRFAEYLERRGSMEYMEHRIEHFEAEFDRLGKEGGSIPDYITAHFDALRRAIKDAPPEGDERTTKNQGDA